MPLERAGKMEFVPAKHVKDAKIDRRIAACFKHAFGHWRVSWVVLFSVGARPALASPFLKGRDD
jgi:gamma-glutamylcysteine synthetase